jgi:hypothetical protein
MSRQNSWIGFLNAESAIFGSTPDRAERIADRLLQPERLEQILASVFDRRQERAERRREHIADLNKRIAKTDLRLKRFHDTIKAGVADLDDPVLKECVAILKATRD